MTQELPIIFFETADEWEQWLAKNYNSQPGVWLKFAKKSSGIPSLGHATALDPALCYGWIDGQTKSYEAPYYLQKFTPRRPKSLWSKINIAKVEQLIAEGKMQPAGIAAIEAAKADGRWDAAYDSPKNVTVPDDFSHALAQNPQAEEFFAQLNKTNRYAYLWRIMTAKRAETRARRIQQFVQMLSEGKKFH